MQSSSSDRPFKPNLVGASPTKDATFARPSPVVREAQLDERHSAKVEVAGANPAVDANFAFVPQQLQEESCKFPFVGASPTEGSILLVIMM